MGTIVLDNIESVNWDYDYDKESRACSLSFPLALAPSADWTNKDACFTLEACPSVECASNPSKFEYIHGGGRVPLHGMRGIFKKSVAIGVHLWESKFWLPGCAGTHLSACVHAQAGADRRLCCARSLYLKRAFDSQTIHS